MVQDTDGASCALCSEPVTEEDGFSFPRLDADDPLIRTLDGAVAHHQCLAEWSKLDAFVDAWNRQVRRLLPDHELVVRDGRLQHGTGRGLFESLIQLGRRMGI